MKIILFFIVGGLALLSPYTLLLGVVILILAIIGIFTPKCFKLGLESTFSNSPTLGFETEYGIDNEHVWIKNDGLYLQAQPRHIQTMEIKRGWMILSVTAMPPIYLPISRMKATESYDNILAILRWNGIDTTKAENTPDETKHHIYPEK